MNKQLPRSLAAKLQHIARQINAPVDVALAFFSHVYKAEVSQMAYRKPSFFTRESRRNVAAYKES